MTEPGTQEWGMRMIIVARCIERIGDNAVDMGEQIEFLVHRGVRGVQRRLSLSAVHHSVHQL